MKIYILPADTYGCGHYRLIWPAHICRRDHGLDVSIIPPGKPGEHSGFQAKLHEVEPGRKEIISLSVPDDMDVMVVQRPAHQYQPMMIKALVDNGITVVVDMDDDMTHIHKKNIAYATYDPRSDSPFSWKYAADSCRLATYVTTSTQALQRVYARPGRGAVLDNYVPAATLGYDKPETGTFGWAGTTASHPDDLTACGDAVQKLVTEGEKFKVVGASEVGRRGLRDTGIRGGITLKNTVKKDLRLREEPEYTGTVPIQDWIKTIGASLDIGMVPLTPGPFNDGKSRLKGIEYMAAGCAWVASPRAEYRRLVKESGCGLLAESGRDWYTHLKRLLNDDPLRKDQVEAGQEYMQTQTYERQAWRWAEVWTRAYDIHHGRAT